MAKWFGKVYYSNTEEVETAPGVWKDDITLQNEISILADPYAMQNFQYIRAVEVMGTLWKVTAVDVQYPRLSLSVGGVYNGEQA